MTKDKIISKTFYEQFNKNYKISKDILEIYIIKGFLLNESLNKLEKIRYLLYSFNYELKYYLNKLCDLDNDLQIGGYQYKILQIMQNLNSLLLYNNDDNTYNLMIYIILERKNHYKKYKKYYEYLLNYIIKKLKCSNNEIFEISYDYDYDSETNNYFFKLKINIIYKNNESLKKIMSLDNKSTKRNILFNNNNLVKNTIELIKNNIINNILKSFY